MKLDGKTKHKLYIRDWHNWNGSVFFGGAGVVSLEKLEKLMYF